MSLQDNRERILDQVQRGLITTDQGKMLRVDDFKKRISVTFKGEAGQKLYWFLLEKKGKGEISDLQAGVLEALERWKGEEDEIQD